MSRSRRLAQIGLGQCPIGRDFGCTDRSTANPITTGPTVPAWQVYLGFNIEHFAFGEGLGAGIGPASPQPDVLNCGWREYGNRVDAWPCLALFDQLGLPAAALINTALHDHCQELVAAFVARGDELAGNAILKQHLIEIVSRCSLIVAVHQPLGNAACEHDEHERIVDCIARGDANQAVASMDQHLRDLERHLALERPAAQKDLAYLLGLS